MKRRCAATAPAARAGACDATLPTNQSFAPFSAPQYTSQQSALPSWATMALYAFIRSCIAFGELADGGRCFARAGARFTRAPKPDTPARARARAAARDDREHERHHHELPGLARRRPLVIVRDAQLVLDRALARVLARAPARAHAREGARVAHPRVEEAGLWGNSARLQNACAAPSLAP